MLTVHDLLESFEHKHRVDIGVLDFFKAFVTVPHPHLLKKLEHLGIRADLCHWLTSFHSFRSREGGRGRPVRDREKATKVTKIVSEKCRIDVAVSPDNILGCDGQKQGIGMIWQHFYLSEY